MDPRSASDVPPSPSRLPLWAGVLLLVLGLLGHVYAAHAMGGSRVAYTHHVLGFFLILLVTGGLIAGLGWLFWRSRSALTVLAIGVVQALLGLWVATAPVRTAAGP
ncbi:MAG TPA: hypothetical protein VG106_13140 [Vicinamibacterales bacterium]|nr:hypothetical protein [Vicinamibacterales bacterium]